jgi:hypothetical protein
MVYLDERLVDDFHGSVHLPDSHKEVAITKHRLGQFLDMVVECGAEQHDATTNSVWIVAWAVLRESRLLNGEFDRVVEVILLKLFKQLFKVKCRWL